LTEVKLLYPNGMGIAAKCISLAIQGSRNANSFSESKLPVSKLTNELMLT